MIWWFRPCKPNTCHFFLIDSDFFVSVAEPNLDANIFAFIPLVILHLLFLYVLHLLFWSLVFLQMQRKTNCCSVSCAQWFFCVVPKVKSCQNSFSFVTLFSTSTVTRKYCLSEIEGNITNAKASFERIDLCNTRGQGLSKWLLNNFDTDTCTWCWY